MCLHLKDLIRNHIFVCVYRQDVFNNTVLNTTYKRRLMITKMYFILDIEKGIIELNQQLDVYSH